MRLSALDLATRKFWRATGRPVDPQGDESWLAAPMGVEDWMSAEAARRGGTLVDDDPDVLASLERGLRLSGFEVSTAVDGAEALRGVVLVAPADEELDGEGFYPEDLRGLEVVDGQGERLGAVKDLHLRPAQDLLEVTTTAGHDVLVPFVEELVPHVDLEAGQVTVTAPAGLLEPLA